MGIKRGSWKNEAINKVAAVKSGNSGARPVNVNVVSGSSVSEQKLSKQGVVSDFVAPAGVSEFRQEELRGTIGDPTRTKNGAQASAPVIAHSNSYKKAQELKEKYGMSKTAGINTSGGSYGGGSGSVVRQAPEVYSPLFQMANLQLPRERITMNAWNRNFYDTNPLVHNCINLHATYPINKIHIKCKDLKIEQFFNDMADNIDLMGVLQEIALEFWKLAEVFPYAELDEKRGVWKSIILQNPDYIHVKTSVLGGTPVISMRPDAALQKLVQSSNPADAQLRSQIDENILYHIRRGENIPLDNFHISHLKMTSAPYDAHGTSLIVSIYKDLMLYDKLRESKFAQADNLVNPITLVKVGGAGEGEYHPNQEDLEHWRQILEAGQYDKDYKIISHAAVAIERVGASGAIIDISNDMNQITDNILYGLMVPKAVITQDGASFSSASIGLEVLKQRYESFRNMMSQWLTKKIFAPISEIQEFYEYKDGEKKLIVPEIEWNKMVLYDMDNYINILNGLVQAQTVSKTTLFKSLGLSIEEERRNIKEEMINQAILAKEASILQSLNLGALRSLKSDQDLIEPTESSPLPGTLSGGEESGIPGAGGLLGGGAPAPLLGGPGGSLGGPGGGDLGLGGPLGGPGGAPPPPTTPPPLGK